LLTSSFVAFWVRRQTVKERDGQGAVLLEATLQASGTLFANRPLVLRFHVQLLLEWHHEAQDSKARRLILVRHAAHATEVGA